MATRTLLMLSAVLIDLSRAEMDWFLVENKCYGIGRELIRGAGLSSNCSSDQMSVVDNITLLDALADVQKTALRNCTALWVGASRVSFNEKSIYNWEATQEVVSDQLWSPSARKTGPYVAMEMVNVTGYETKTFRLQDYNSTAQVVLYYLCQNSTRCNDNSTASTAATATPTAAQTNTAADSVVAAEILPPFTSAVANSAETNHTESLQNSTATSPTSSPSTNSNEMTDDLPPSASTQTTRDLTSAQPPATQHGPSFSACVCVSVNKSQTPEIIQRELIVQKSSLSKQVRKLVSATDVRPSAVATGILGVAFLVLMSGLILVPDLVQVMSCLIRFVKKSQ